MLEYTVDTISEFWDIESIRRNIWRSFVKSKERVRDGDQTKFDAQVLTRKRIRLPNKRTRIKLNNWELIFLPKSSNSSVVAVNNLD